jgi:hypothetical protein
LRANSAKNVGAVIAFVAANATGFRTKHNKTTKSYEVLESFPDHSTLVKETLTIPTGDLVLYKFQKPHVSAGDFKLVLASPTDDAHPRERWWIGFAYNHVEATAEGSTYTVIGHPEAHEPVPVELFHGFLHGMVEFYVAVLADIEANA